MDMHYKQISTQPDSFRIGLINFTDFLKKNEKFIITTHQNPDGDGLGSEIALHEFLLKSGKKSIIINHDPLPHNFQFLNRDNEFYWIKDPVLKKFDPRDQALIVLDAHSSKRIGDLEREFFPLIKQDFFIDHHPCPNELIEKYFCHEQATSTGELIYYIFRHFKERLTHKASQGIYTSILTDTGSFRFPKTDWKTHRIISHLLRNGVNPSAVYQEVYENKSHGRLILLKSFLNTLTFEFEGKLAFSYVSEEMLEEAKVDESETDGLVNMPLENKGVKVSILVKIFDEYKKVSLRSKGAIDVSEVAAKFNGGGHYNAAGFRIKSDKWENINHFKQLLLKEFEPVFNEL